MGNVTLGYIQCRHENKMPMGTGPSARSGLHFELDFLSWQTDFLEDIDYKSRTDAGAVMQQCDDVNQHAEVGSAG